MELQDGIPTDALRGTVAIQDLSDRMLDLEAKDLIDPTEPRERSQLSMTGSCLGRRVVVVVF